MGLFDWFNRRSEEIHRQKLDFEREKHEQRLDLDRRKRELELRVREKEAELDRIRLDRQILQEKAEIEEDFSDQSDENDDTDPTLKIFGPMIAGMINKTNSPQVNSMPTTEYPITNIDTSHVVGVEFTDEEINDIYKAFKEKDPQMIDYAKSMPDNLIKTFIKQKYPQIGENSLNRMIARVKR